MNEIVYIIWTLLTGGLMGTLLFSGLWLTEKENAGTKPPAFRHIGSFLLQAAVVTGGFCAVSWGSWPKFLLCLLGFIIARLLISRYLRNAPEETTI